MRRWKRLLSVDQILITYCCCTAAILIFLGVFVSIEAIDGHSHANSYNIKGQCTVINIDKSPVISCGVDLKCSFEAEWTYYFSTNHMECIDKDVEIKTTEQLKTNEDPSFGIGSTRDCFTNKECDNVYFGQSFNDHHFDAVAKFIGVSILFSIACCCICCAFRVIHMARKQKKFDKLSRINSIPVADKHTFCINSMLKECYHDYHILPEAIKQIICDFADTKYKNDGCGHETISLLNK